MWVEIVVRLCSLYFIKVDCLSNYNILIIFFFFQLLINTICSYCYDEYKHEMNNSHFGSSLGIRVFNSLKPGAICELKFLLGSIKWSLYFIKIEVICFCCYRISMCRAYTSPIFYSLCSQVSFSFRKGSTWINGLFIYLVAFHREYFVRYIVNKLFKYLMFTYW